MKESGLRWLVWGFWAGAAASGCVLATVLYWRIVSPVPNIIVRESFIEEVEPKDADSVLHRPGMFRVVRNIESDDEVHGRITAYFETPQREGKLTSSDGTEARRVHISIKIAEDEDHIQKGREWRTRVWETPPTLPDGDWVYVSVLRVCNPIRCDYFTFPPIPVRLGGPAGARFP